MMQYDEFYTELGKIFYLVAAADGKVNSAEKEKLTQLIKSNWTSLEESTDLYGTDKAHYIDFAFEYAESEEGAEGFLDEFELFYKQNKEDFTPEVKKNIRNTCKAIAEAYKGKNTEEKHILDKLFAIIK